MKPPVLLDDGRVAFGLRDDATAAIYAGRVNEFPWTRVGRPVSHVVGIGARRYRLSWVVSAISGENTFCDGGPWPARETLPPGTPLGNSVQVVTVNSEVLFEDHRLEEFVFHETGACAVVRGIVHDFPTGARFELPADATELTFW